MGFGKPIKCSSDHFINYDPPRKRMPTFAKSVKCRTAMTGLLQWEYGRQWLKERDDYVQEIHRLDKPQKTCNDCNGWIETRKPKKLLVRFKLNKK